MAYENNENNERRQESVYSARIKAGKRRTYFFDVRETRGNDFYLTITESRKKFEGEGYDRHKIFVYKEDFNKFVRGLTETVDHVKTVLMPDFDFDVYNHDRPYEGEDAANDSSIIKTETAAENNSDKIVESIDTPEAAADIHREEVDKW